MSLMDLDTSHANHDTLSPEPVSEKGSAPLISGDPTPLPKPVPWPIGRVRVDGKFFARGRGRLRIHGVTYGPFAPNAGGEQFPSPEAVVVDFARMRAIGINSVRPYHLPLEWFFELADQEGVLLAEIVAPKIAESSARIPDCGFAHPGEVPPRLHPLAPSHFTRDRKRWPHRPVNGYGGGAGVVIVHLNE